MTTEYPTKYPRLRLSETAAALSRALDLLERHQWADTNDDSEPWHRCPECDGKRGGPAEYTRPSPTGGHKPDCELALLLKDNGREVRYAE